MSKRPPRPLWPLLTTALIGLPVLYVTSFGPACWIRSWLCDEMDEMAGIAFSTAYLPLALAITDGPPSVAESVRRYGELGMKPRSLMFFDMDGASPVLNGPD